MKIFNIYWWKRIINYPFDLYLEIKWFIQRGRRGYSDKDTWDIDSWLSNIMPNILKQFKSNKQGIPSSVFTEKAQLNKNGSYTNKESKRAEIRWEKALDNMIYTFETAQKMINDTWHYTESNVYNTKDNIDLRENLREFPSIKIMTLKECKRYEMGWFLFQKHFFALWD